MKILSIHINNLASLDGETEIDFTSEPLRSAGIFAITGPTGAGKSTILDALCLALYARTPRYKMAEHGVDIADVEGSTIKQDDVRGILRDGSASGYAEVDFEGVDGRHYRARWSVRRAYNKPDGSLQPYEVSLKDVTDDKDIPGKKTELSPLIERLVGLNFEQFTRSVLLAQGDFTAFLKAGRDEKASLLEKLTGTHIYSEISKKVFDHYRDQQTKLRELNLRREGIVILTSEERSALNDRRTALASAVETEEKALSDLNKELLWHERHRELLDQLEAAKVAFSGAMAQKEAALPRKELLQQIISVQPAKPIVGDLRNLREQIILRKKRLEELLLEGKLLDEKKAQAKSALDLAVTAFEKSTIEEEEARPALDRAKEIDIQLKENARQLAQAQEELTVVRQKETSHHQQLSVLEEAVEKVQKEIETLERWKSSNEQRKAVAEQEQLIVSKLRDAADILQSRQHYSSRLQAAEEQTNLLQKEKLLLATQDDSLLSELTLSRERCQKELEVLSAIPVHEIEEKKSRIDSFIEEWIAASAHWTLLYQALQEKEASIQSLQRDILTQKEVKSRLSEAENQLELRKSARDTSSRMLEMARLTAAENVEQLRAGLKDGEHCPVCGSIDHPYTKHHPAVDKILAELEQSHRQTEEAYTQQLSLHSALSEKCSGLRQSIAEKEEKVAKLDKSLNMLEQKWNSFVVAEQSISIPFEERSQWLKEGIADLKKSQEQLQRELLEYAKLKDQFEKSNQQLSKQEKEYSGIENRIKDIDRTVTSLQEQRENDKKEHSLKNKQLEEVAQTLSFFFPDEQWFENWQAHPVQFVDRITSFSKNWKNNTARLDEQMRVREMQMEKRKGLLSLLKDIRDEVKVKQDKLHDLQKAQKDLSDLRRSLFDGQPTSEVETKHREAIASAKKAWEGQSKLFESLQADITRNETQSAQEDKELCRLEDEVVSLDQKLREWISNHNREYGEELNDEMLHELLVFTQEWIEKERESLQIIENEVTRTHSIMEERDKSLAQHLSQRPSERLPEELSALAEDLRERLEKDRQRVNEIDFNLKHDDTQRKQLGSLLTDIEKQEKVVDDWAKLNEVIGSADGKKFRQIAQEYTLDVLLGYANVHLEMLSRRYRLERIPNTLGLQVVDQDMGDEVRTVYSLSGGESFLVSLALALGLASLSSNRMKVESLFIDEGFGSLDPTTLTIAMDALERLHNQGRKVGVISHVQEMTERIPVQIRVNKLQSGKSKVEVVGV